MSDYYLYPEFAAGVFVGNFSACDLADRVRDARKIHIWHPYQKGGAVCECVSRNVPDLLSAREFGTAAAGNDLLVCYEDHGPLAAITDLTAGTDFQTANSFGALIVSNINASISSRAAPGAQMDFVNAPNATAVGVIQSGLATHTDATTIESAITALGSPMQATAHPTVGGYASGQDPATLVLDATASAHNTAGTIGQKINSTASGLLSAALWTLPAGPTKRCMWT